MPDREPFTFDEETIELLTAAGRRIFDRFLDDYKDIMAGVDAMIEAVLVPKINRK